MWKMDTKEYAPMTFTKNINANGNYGCARCCDDRHQLTDPTRPSFQYIRSNDHILELSGTQNQNIDIPHHASDDCKTFDSWKDKGCGYTPPDLELVQLQLQSDPHYSITTDMYHAAKNTFQQIFITFIKRASLSKDESFSLFAKIKDFMLINHIEAKMTDEDYKGPPLYIKDISLESAPYALVRFLFNFSKNEW